MGTFINEYRAEHFHVYGYHVFVLFFWSKNVHPHKKTKNTIISNILS